MLSATLFEEAIEPRAELLAYEALWAQSGQTEKTLAQLFASHQGTSPRDLFARLPVDVHASPAGRTRGEDLIEEVKRQLANLRNVSICVRGMAQYPERLRDARYPVELFYYRGDLSLTERPCVSIVGAREASEDGMKRAQKLARGLVKNGYTIVSGLARGIDTAALTEAIRCNGKVIAVIGTPITEYYPKENRDLQDLIGLRHLLMSQVPIVRYQIEGFNQHRIHFPQRNVTMAALSQATVIVEASETSGTHSQALACFQQGNGRKLFILNSCFERPGIRWPHLYEEKGAIRVRVIDDILQHLPPVAHGEVDETRPIDA